MAMSIRGFALREGQLTNGHGWWDRLLKDLRIEIHVQVQVHVRVHDRVRVQIVNRELG